MEEALLLLSQEDVLQLLDLVKFLNHERHVQFLHELVRRIIDLRFYFLPATTNHH